MHKHVCRFHFKERLLQLSESGHNYKIHAKLPEHKLVKPKIAVRQNVYKGSRIKTEDFCKDSKSELKPQNRCQTQDLCVYSRIQLSDKIFIHILESSLLNTRFAETYVNLNQAFRYKLCIHISGQGLETQNLFTDLWISPLSTWLVHLF